MSANESPFHRGEKELQSRLGMRDKMEQLGRRVIRDHMPDQHREFFSQLALVFVGSADDSGRPWASVVTGKPGFVQAPDAHTLRLGTRPIYGDPLHKALVAGADLGALGIEFHTRRRNRVNGKIARVGDGEIEIAVTQSFGNCPKYIQARELTPETVGTSGTGDKRPVRRGQALNRAEAALIARADTFFVASQFSEHGGWTDGIDVSHRGGPPGFVMVAHETSLLFPDYTGNCMFNTLGNISVNPRAGLLFIDFVSGDTLQLTGEAEILWAQHHASRFAGARRVVSFRVEETLHIERALPLSWTFQSYSPVFDDFEPAALAAPAADAVSAMTLVGVNRAMPKQIVHEGKTVTTGIFKEPAADRVLLRRLNLEDDGQADLWGHGGAFRAVYVYSTENYDYWQRELGRDDFVHGQFGENFTVAGMPDDEICIGDRFRIGAALVEVSQPRIPCYKLAIKMGIDGFQNQFLDSGRVGFYFRVIEEGEVGAGDAIRLVARDPRRMSVREVSNLLFFDKDDLAAARKALSIPALSPGWKGSFEERLAQATEATGAEDGFHTFVVDRKVAESETITSFYLTSADGAPLQAFLPGQFLTFKLDLPGRSEPLIRTYSLSDSANGDYYRISIKRELAPSERPDLPPGLSSNYFHDHVDTGTALTIGPPRGKFHLDQESGRAVVLLSAGVGLTPMLSMLNALVEGRAGRPVWFVHGARNGREHAMAAHVRRLAREHEKVTAHIRYSDPAPDAVAANHFDSVGRVDIALLKRVLPFDDYDFYLCGPPPFMKSLYCGLLGLGIAAPRIHYEFFGPASALTDEAEPCGQAKVRTAAAEVSGDVRVSFARSGVTAAWDPACATILDLAEQHGLSPDYSCRSGICHTCISTLVEGEVEYLEQPLQAPPAGSVLICCARPTSDLVIEV